MTDSITCFHQVAEDARLVGMIPWGCSSTLLRGSLRRLSQNTGPPPYGHKPAGNRAKPVIGRLEGRGRVFSAAVPARRAPLTRHWRLGHVRLAAVKTIALSDGDLRWVFPGLDDTADVLDLVRQADAEIRLLADHLGVRPGWTGSGIEFHRMPSGPLAS
jgi:hypothetical protein